MSSSQILAIALGTAALGDVLVALLLQGRLGERQRPFFLFAMATSAVLLLGFALSLWFGVLSLP